MGGGEGCRERGCCSGVDDDACSHASMSIMTREYLWGGTARGGDGFAWSFEGLIRLSDVAVRRRFRSAAQTSTVRTTTASLLRCMRVKERMRILQWPSSGCARAEELDLGEETLESRQEAECVCIPSLHLGCVLDTQTGKRGKTRVLEVRVQSGSFMHLRDSLRMS